MKILITSGGTKVPIDPVRDITNMSRGTFGSKIALEALKNGHEVIYLCAEDARRPFKLEYNFYDDKRKITDVFKQIQSIWEQCGDKYREVVFRNYNDYATRVGNLMFNDKPDVVILAAAVSDYSVVYIKDKIKSINQQHLDLVPTEKVISRIKEWQSNVFLVGFKLLTHADDALLTQEAIKSIDNNRCDLVVANSLETLKSGKHRILLVENSDKYYKVTAHIGDIAKQLMERIEERTK